MELLMALWQLGIKAQVSCINVTKCAGGGALRVLPIYVLLMSVINKVKLGVFHCTHFRLMFASMVYTVGKEKVTTAKIA